MNSYSIGGQYANLILKPRFQGNVGDSKSTRRQLLGHLVPSHGGSSEPDDASAPPTDTVEVATSKPANGISRRRVLRGAAAIAVLLALQSVLRLNFEKIRAFLVGFRDETTPQDTTRRMALKAYILDHYTQQGKRKIDWYDFAEIVDAVAHQRIYQQTGYNDEDFRRDLWALFGNKDTDPKTSVSGYLDQKNTGLNDRQFHILNEDADHNVLYAQEQMHHFLGGVTGDNGSKLGIQIGNTIYGVPSNILNEPLPDEENEAEEWHQIGHWNQGDMNLFQVSRPFRDDFLRGFPNQGRFTVAPNICKILDPEANPERYQDVLSEITGASS